MFDYVENSLCKMQFHKAQNCYKLMLITNYYGFWARHKIFCIILFASSLSSSFLLSLRLLSFLHFTLSSFLYSLFLFSNLKNPWHQSLNYNTALMKIVASFCIEGSVGDGLTELQLTLSRSFFEQTTAPVLLAWRKHKRASRYIASIKSDEPRNQTVLPISDWAKLLEL